MTDPDALSKVKAAYDSSRYSEAETLIAEYAQSLSAEEVAYWRGMLALAQQHPVEEGRRHFLDAQDENPHHWKSMYQLGVLAEADGKQASAVRWYRLCLAEQPAHGGAKNGLARLGATPASPEPAGAATAPATAAEQVTMPTNLPTPAPGSHILYVTEEPREASETAGQMIGGSRAVRITGKLYENGTLTRDAYLELRGTRIIGPVPHQGQWLAYRDRDFTSSGSARSLTRLTNLSMNEEVEADSTLLGHMPGSGGFRTVVRVIFGFIAVIAAVALFFGGSFFVQAVFPVDVPWVPGCGQVCPPRHLPAGPASDEDQGVDEPPSASSGFIPDVVGSTWLDAVEELRQAGFTNVVTDQVDSDQPVFTVLTISPGAGTELAFEDVVTLQISNGFSR